MKPSRLLLAAVLLAAVLAFSPRLGHSTIQEESCIEPDVEYPVPCDDGE